MYLVSYRSNPTHLLSLCRFCVPAAEIRSLQKCISRLENNNKALTKELLETREALRETQAVRYRLLLTCAAAEATTRGSTHYAIARGFELNFDNIGDRLSTASRICQPSMRISRISTSTNDERNEVQLGTRGVLGGIFLTFFPTPTNKN